MKRDESGLPVPNRAGSSETTREGVVRRLPIGKTDIALVTSLRAEEPGAAEVLFDRYGPYVERLIVRSVGFDPEVPDLINEVFARALEGIQGLRDSSALKGWIGSIAMFTARGFLRNRKSLRRWLQFLPPAEVPETAAPVALPEVSDLLAHTYAALDALPADERIAFVLRFIEGMDLVEVAQMAGVSLATIERRLARAQQLFGDASRNDALLREHVLEHRGGRYQ